MPARRAASAMGPRPGPAARPTVSGLCRRSSSGRPTVRASSDRQRDAAVEREESAQDVADRAGAPPATQAPRRPGSPTRRGRCRGPARPCRRWRSGAARAAASVSPTDGSASRARRSSGVPTMAGAAMSRIAAPARGPEPLDDLLGARRAGPSARWRRSAGRSRSRPSSRDAGERRAPASCGPTRRRWRRSGRIPAR